MNKNLILGVLVAVALIVLSSFAVYAEDDQGNGPVGEGKPMLISSGPIINGSLSGPIGEHQPRGFAYGKNRIRNDKGDEIEIEKNGEMKLRKGNITAHSEFNITGEGNQNRTRLRIHFPNGHDFEIKIMPDTANERALEMLKLHVCNESNNCTIQLKQVGQGNETRASYEMQAERHFKLFGLFERKAQVRAQVDAESGNVTSTEGPWWSFLASQPAE